MNKKLLASLVGAALIGASGAAFSAEAYFDTGVDGEAPILGALFDADSVSAPFVVMNTNPNATSVYTGGDVADDQILSVGETFDFRDQGSTRITSFNDSVGVMTPDAFSLEGFNATWGLVLEYDIQGTAQFVGAADIDTSLLGNGATFATGEGMAPTFATGTLKLIYKELNAASPFNTLTGISDGQQVLEMTLSPGGVLSPGNLLLEGFVDYAWFDTPPGDPTTPADTGVGSAGYQIKNLFNFVDPVGGNMSFYDIWLDGALAAMPIATIEWGLNTNVEPNLIPLVAGNSGILTNPGCTQPAGGTALCRTTNLNLDIGFDPVPAPAALALIGAGLLGFSATRKRRVVKMA